MFSDLGMDYVNPIEVSKRLNRVSSSQPSKFVVGDAGNDPAHNVGRCIFSVVQLDSVHPQCAAAVPLLSTVLFALLFIYSRSKRNQHLLQATDVFRQLPERKWEALYKIAFYMASFFYYLFRMVYTLMD